MRTQVHTNMQGSKDTKTEGSPGIWESQEHPPLVSQSVPVHPPSQQETARPSGPIRPPGAWAQSQPGGWGVSLIVPLVAHPAKETAAGFSHQMTGNAMEGYSASNYYFEKGEEKKC